MNDKFMMFAADANRWEKLGMPLKEEDALILALWRWYRGRPEAASLPYGASLIYGDMTERLAACEKNRMEKARAGRAGGIKTQLRNRTAKAELQAALLKPSTPTPTPTPTSTPTSTSTSTSTERDGGAAPKPPVSVKNVFVKPTKEEVRQYIAEMQLTNVDAEQFVDYYESNGWKVGGRSTMRDWRASVRTWHRNSFGDKGAKKETTPFVQQGYQIRLGKESK